LAHTDDDDLRDGVPASSPGALPGAESLRVVVVRPSSSTPADGRRGFADSIIAAPRAAPAGRRLPSLVAHVYGHDRWVTCGALADRLDRLG
jgi:hypothetical protein